MNESNEQTQLNFEKSLRSLESIVERMQNESMDLDELVKESGAALWIHGHTHGCCDYVLGATRLVANACGYPFERTGFKANRVVEL